MADIRSAKAKEDRGTIIFDNPQKRQMYDLLTGRNESYLIRKSTLPGCLTLEIKLQGQQGYGADYVAQFESQRFAYYDGKWNLANDTSNIKQTERLNTGDISSKSSSLFQAINEYLDKRGLPLITADNVLHPSTVLQKKAEEYGSYVVAELDPKPSANVYDTTHDRSGGRQSPRGPVTEAVIKRETAAALPRTQQSPRRFT